jgi:TorA maturation chaperone TorD
MSSIESALARAQVYGAAAAAFGYPSDDTAMQGIADAASQSRLAAEFLGFAPETVLALDAFSSEAEKTNATELKKDYDRLFIGRGTARLDESEYDEHIFNRYQRMADIAGFYKAFGFEAAEASPERPDFVGSEFEFMNLLSLKEAYAVEQDWPEQTKVCRDAQAKFFTEHLEWWVPPMSDKLAAATECPYYLALASMLKALISEQRMQCLQPA